MLTGCILKTKQSVHNNSIVIHNDSIPFRLDTLNLFFPLQQAGLGAAINANALDSLSNIWYSKMLTAMQEPVLCGNEDAAEIYRFTWLILNRYQDI